MTLQLLLLFAYIYFYELVILYDIDIIRTSIKHMKFELFLLGSFIMVNYYVHFEQSLDALTADHNGDLLEFPKSCWKLSKLMLKILYLRFFFLIEQTTFCARFQ